MHSNTLTLRALTAGAVLASLAGAAHGQCGMPLALLSATDKGPGDNFGSSLALGQTAAGSMLLMIGSPDHTAGNLSACGSVYAFSKINNQWGQTGMLAAPDAEAFDYFGSSLQYFEPFMIVGAPGAGTGGAAYIFERFGSSWSQRAKISGGSGDGVGNAVWIGDSLAIVGSPNADVTTNSITDADAGRTTVYRRNANGTWTQAGTFSLIASVRNPGDHYGASVGCYDNRIMAGIPGFDVYDIQSQTTIPNAGAVEISRYDAATSTWFSDGWLLDPQPYQDDNFGAVVRLGQGYAAVAAPGLR